jgi:hypothetical protein
MKSIAKISLILATVVATGMLWHVAPCAAETRFSSIQRAAEGQIERIKAARERADERLEVTQDRSFEELRRSEEDLLRQIEILERVREQVQDQMRESDSASRSRAPEAMQELCASLSEIEVQLSGARALAKQLEAIRQEAESKAAKSGRRSDASTESGYWNVPSGSGSTLRDTGISSCASELSPTFDPLAPPSQKGG